MKKLLAASLVSTLMLGSAAFAQSNNANTDPSKPRSTQPETNCPAGTDCRDAAPNTQGSSDAAGEQGRSSTGSPAGGVGAGGGAGAGAGAGAGGGAGGASGGAGGGAGGSGGSN